MWNLTGWIFSVHHPEHHCTSLIQVVLQKAVCFVQLLELKERGDFIVSQSNIRSHPVNHSKQTLKQQGLFWGIWFCTGHRCFFLNDNFLLLVILVLAIILKQPLIWQILFIIWQGREILAFQETWGMWMGWNYTTVLSARVAEHLISREVPCALLEKLI